MARNYKKEMTHIMHFFDQECAELCYTDFIPNEVEKARQQLRESMSKSPTEMERIKANLMANLRGTFFDRADSFDLSQATYLANGSKRLS